MTTEIKNQGRRKFIAWGVASATVLAAFKFIKPAPKKTETVKMLTQDGKLVEIDMSALPSEKKRITDKELQNWVKK